MEKNIKGKCPCCAKDADFRPLTISEDLLNIGKVSFGFFTGNKLKKAKNLALTIKDAADTRKFPNFICTKCNKQVMQCSRCQMILVYSDFNINHIC